VRYRAVFFDAGETLVHPSPSFPELFAQVVTREGHDVRPDDVQMASNAVSDGFSQAARANRLWTTTSAGSRTFWLSVYDLMLGPLGLPTDDGLGETLYDAFTDRSNYVLFDDVRSTLDELTSEGYALGLISNFEAWLDDLLLDLGVREAFAVRVISGVEGVEKPDPRIYRLALERADVDARDSAYVGDSPEFDVDPPAALGMFPILIDRRERHIDHAGTRITDMGHLPEALRD
jgi:putative hydrolase of the HAD superfamily